MKLTKIILSLMLVALIGIEAYSNPVDAETAKRVAQNFMGRSRGTSKTVSNVVAEQSEGHNSFYVVNFHEGGWVMVSAENSTIPVLAFSLDGTYYTDDEKPEGLLYLMDDYKEQVNISRNALTTRSGEVIAMWNQLLTDEDSGGNTSQQSSISSTSAYIPGTHLLTDPARGGEVAWGQDLNNNWGCSPSYNSEITGKWFGELFGGCDCGNPPVGCGAVALGQLMWYWKWPQSSIYRTYNWDLMPNKLEENITPPAAAKEIARLLLDCGEASDMLYTCFGSATTKVESALKNTFGYKAARRVNRKDMSSGGWNYLVRTEIDKERPVIMYGAEKWTIDKKHYFIVDGYSTIDPNYFHINFGWRGDYTDKYYYLGNINPGNSYYSDNNYAIVDIFPPPTILGPSTLCSRADSYTLDHRSDVTTWSISPPDVFRIINLNTSAIAIEALKLNGQTGTLTATVGGYTVTKTIQTCVIPIDGPSTLCVTGRYSVNSNGYDNLGSASWTIVPANAYSITASNRTSARVTATNFTGQPGTLTAVFFGAASVTKTIQSCAPNIVKYTPGLIQDFPQPVERVCGTSTFTVSGLPANTERVRWEFSGYIDNTPWPQVAYAGLLMPFPPSPPPSTNTVTVYNNIPKLQFSQLSAPIDFNPYGTIRAFIQVNGIEYPLNPQMVAIGSDPVDFTYAAGSNGILSLTAQVPFDTPDNQVFWAIENNNYYNRPIGKTVTLTGLSRGTYTVRIQLSNSCGYGAVTTK